MMVSNVLLIRCAPLTLATKVHVLLVLLLDQATFVMDKLAKPTLTVLPRLVSIFSASLAILKPLLELMVNALEIIALVIATAHQALVLIVPAYSAITTMPI